MPRLWLVTDARNDDAIEAALRAMPRGSGLIFRHYHLPDPARRARFDQVRRLALTRAHRVVLAGSVAQARAWRAQGAYGDARLLARGPSLLRLVAAHSPREIAAARRARAAAILLSPAFPTRSHPGGATLGPVRFHLLAARARVPVIALGGMSAHTARRLGWPRWAAIDGLT